MDAFTIIWLALLALVGVIAVGLVLILVTLAYLMDRAFEQLPDGTIHGIWVALRSFVHKQFIRLKGR